MAQQGLDIVRKSAPTAINKCATYLTDPENLGKKENKEKIKTEIFGYVSKWQDYRYLLGMGFFSHLFMLLKELSFGWQKKTVTVADQERRLEKKTKRFWYVENSVC